MINMPYTLHFSRRAMFTVLLPLVALILSLSIVLSGHFNESAHAGAPTCTWTGAGGGTNVNWSTANNWTCDAGTVPVDGTALIFNLNSASSAATIHNDLSTSLTFSGIQINDTLSSDNQLVSFDGNGFNLAGNISVNYLGNYQYPNIDMRFNSITLSSNVALNMTTTAAGKPGSMLFQYIGDTLALGTHNLTINTGSTLDTNNGTNSVSTYAAVTGSGNLTFVGVNGTQYTNLGIYGNMSAYNGNITTTNLTLSIDCSSATALGTAVGSTTLNGTANISCSTTPAGGYPSSVTIPENINLGPSLVALDINVVTIPDPTQGYTATYQKRFVPGKSLTFSGTITLQSNVLVRTSLNTTFTGPIVGNYQLGVYDNSYLYGDGGSVILNSSSNGSNSPNGTYSPTENGAVTLSDTLPSATVYVGYLVPLYVTGTRSNALVEAGGTLGGTGTIGTLTSHSGTVAPGTDTTPGTLNTGNVSLDAGTTLNEQIGGTTAGSYSQLNVTGTVSLGNAVLNISAFNSYAPVISSVYTIINNDGSDAVTGTFNGLAQNAKVTVGGYTYKISYIGGTGNDVTLTVTGTPGAPDTSGVLAKPANIAVAGGVIIAGVGLLVLRGRYMRTVRK